MDSATDLIYQLQDIVVRLMESCGPSVQGAMSTEGTILFASERAIGDYLSLCHLLSAIAACQPAVKATAERNLLDFIGDGGPQNQKRHKRFTPNLGELLIQLCVTDRVRSLELVRPLLREALTRSVVWSLDPVQGKGVGGLALLEDDQICDWRLEKTFEAQRTSLRLLCFQFDFHRKVDALRHDGQLHKGLDARFGLAPAGLAADLVRSIKTIFALNNFASFSRFL